MLNGNGDWGKYSKILNNTDLAYREIRIERPLKLSFTFFDDTFDKLKSSKDFLKLKKSDQTDIINCLNDHFSNGDHWLSKNEFINSMKEAFNNSDIKLSATIKKAMVNSFGEKDETAIASFKSNNKPEADPELREHELIPYNEDFSKYFNKEIKPFASDAWIDEEYLDHKDDKVGRVGYEINFNKHFFEYKSPRSLKKINNEIQNIENEIAKLLDS
jgi:type I restriction enzyme M protein